MVSRARLKSVLTGLALYMIAAAIVGYFGVNAYTGKYGLNARQELDQEIVALTAELARLKQERAEGEQRVSLLRSDRVDPDMVRVIPAN
jgi:cell division protein FtsB